MTPEDGSGKLRGGATGLVLRRMPGLAAFRRRGAEAWRGDLAAGATLAAYLIPAAIGYASLAGLPPESGLYACLSGGLVFWLFSGSRHTVVSVTTAISLLAGSVLGGLAGGDSARHAALAACAALMVGVLSLAAWALKAGSLVCFVSESVMAGFKIGVALYLASSQLPKLLGLKSPPGEFWERSFYILSHLGNTHVPTLLLGAAALALLFLGKILLPARPVALLVVIGGVVSAHALGLGALGVRTLGDVPLGLPAPGLPPVRAADLNALLPLSIACFLLGAVETSAIGRMFGRKHRYLPDSNQDFLALAAANLASGLGSGYPVSGGMSQSVVNEAAGARSSASSLVAALVLAAASLFLVGWLRDLPQAVLAAVVIAAVTGLVKPSELRRLWRLSRPEFAVALAALAGVLGSGLLRGVLIGALLSLLLLIRRAARPRVAELGRVPGTDYFADLSRDPPAERIPDVLVFRVESALMYFNVDYVRERFARAREERGPGLRLVVFFLGTVPAIDVAGLELLEEVERDLKERGVDLRLAEARGQVRDFLQRAGFDRRGVPVVPHQPVAAVVAVWREGRARAPAVAR